MAKDTTKDKKWFWQKKETGTEESEEVSAVEENDDLQDEQDEELDRLKEELRTYYLEHPEHDPSLPDRIFVKDMNELEEKITEHIPKKIVEDEIIIKNIIEQEGVAAGTGSSPLDFSRMREQDAPKEFVNEVFMPDEEKVEEEQDSKRAKPRQKSSDRQDSEIDPMMFADYAEQAVEEVQENMQSIHDNQTEAEEMVGGDQDLLKDILGGLSFDQLHGGQEALTNQVYGGKINQGESAVDKAEKAKESHVAKQDKEQRKKEEKDVQDILSQMLHEGNLQERVHIDDAEGDETYAPKITEEPAGLNEEVAAEGADTFGEVSAEETEEVSALKNKLQELLSGGMQSENKSSTDKSSTGEAPQKDENMMNTIFVSQPKKKEAEEGTEQEEQKQDAAQSRNPQEIKEIKEAIEIKEYQIDEEAVTPDIQEVKVPSWTRTIEKVSKPVEETKLVQTEPEETFLEKADIDIEEKDTKPTDAEGIDQEAEQEGTNKEATNAKKKAPKAKKKDSEPFNIEAINLEAAEPKKKSKAKKKSQETANTVKVALDQEAENTVKVALDQEVASEIKVTPSLKTGAESAAKITPEDVSPLEVTPTLGLESENAIKAALDKGVTDAVKTALDQEVASAVKAVLDQEAVSPVKVAPNIEAEADSEAKVVPEEEAVSTEIAGTKTRNVEMLGAEEIVLEEDGKNKQLQEEKHINIENVTLVEDVITKEKTILREEKVETAVKVPAKAAVMDVLDLGLNKGEEAKKIGRVEERDIVNMPQAPKKVKTEEITVANVNETEDDMEEILRALNEDIAGTKSKADNEDKEDKVDARKRKRAAVLDKEDVEKKRQAVTEEASEVAKEIETAAEETEEIEAIDEAATIEITSKAETDQKETARKRNRKRKKTEQRKIVREKEQPEEQREEIEKQITTALAIKGETALVERKEKQGFLSRFFQRVKAMFLPKKQSTSVLERTYAQAKAKSSNEEQQEIKINGVVSGSIQGENIIVNPHAIVKNDIIATGVVYCMENAVVMGNVKGAEVLVEGVIRGDVYGITRVLIEGNGVVSGDIHENYEYIEGQAVVHESEQQEEQPGREV